MFSKPGFIFWPVGTGDSTSIVINDKTIVQVDLRHLEKSEDADDDHAAIIDRLVDKLPQVDGKPYLAAFALTHPDLDHIQGFEELLDQVTIGELWFTPRVFREYNVDLCDDAVAFKDESDRRVEVMIETNGAANAGDRLRLVGYDDLLKEDDFTGFPDNYLTIPGNAVTEIDGVDYTGAFRAFIHAPFKDDSAGDRNETSLAMQVVLGDDPSAGGALLFGDLSYPTIRKIFDVTKDGGNEENLAWSVFLAPHHCSKSVMYQKNEADNEELKDDILDELSDAQVGEGYIVASSEKIPSQNSKGDNPPHAKAKDRYEEIADGGFICTHEDGDAGEPLAFNATATSIVFVTDGGIVAERSDPIDSAVETARGGDEPPNDKVGFGH